MQCKVYLLLADFLAARTAATAMPSRFHASIDAACKASSSTRTHTVVLNCHLCSLYSLQDRIVSQWYRWLPLGEDCVLQSCCAVMQQDVLALSLWLQQEQRSTFFLLFYSFCSPRQHSQTSQHTAHQLQTGPAQDLSNTPLQVNIVCLLQLFLSCLT